MSNPDRKNKKQTDHGARLGSLMEKKRSREKTRKVEDVLARDISPEEKIRIIDAIDNDKTTVELSALEEYGKDLASLIRKGEILTGEAARQLQKNVKKLPRRSTFWEYLFHQFRAMRAYCRKSSFIEVHLLPPRAVFDKKVTEIFVHRIRNDANELSSSLRLILSIAWQHLSKMEYNLLVQLDRLCSRISGLHIQLLDFRHGTILDQIILLERHFIICNYKQHYPELIVKRLKEVVRLHPELSIKSSRIITLVRSLLDTSTTSASMGGFLLAANMAKYRRMLHFNELYWEGYPSVINNFDFECGDEIRKNIDFAIEKLKEDMISQLHEKREMDHIAAYIEITADGDFDYRLLEKFYNFSAHLNEGSFEGDRENMILFVIRFFDAFFSSCMELLTGEVNLPGGKKGRIFSTSYFQFEMEKIYLLQQRLAKYPYAIKEFPREFFTRLVKNPGNESGPRREAAGITRELLEHLSTITTGLMKLLKGHNGDAAAFAAGEPRAISEELVKNSGFAIPYYAGKLEEGGFFGEMTVRDALTDLVSTCLLFSRFIRDEEAQRFTSILEDLDRDIDKSRETLRRLATVVQFQKICEQYGL